MTRKTPGIQRGPYAVLWDKYKRDGCCLLEASVPIVFYLSTVCFHYRVQCLNSGPRAYRPPYPFQPFLSSSFFSALIFLSLSFNHVPFFSETSLLQPPSPPNRSFRLLCKTLPSHSTNMPRPATAALASQPSSHPLGASLSSLQLIQPQTIFINGTTPLLRWQTVDENSIYRIGNISKAFTVYTFLLELGDRYWNDAVSSHVPELAAASTGNVVTQVQWDQVTLGDLAGQMAGIDRDCELSRF